MSISSSVRKAGPYVGNDATTVFPFTFKVFTAADVRVVRTDLAGVESDWTLNTEYTVSLNANQDNDPGGSVTAAVALPLSELLTLTSNLDITQPLVLTNNGGFYPQVINNAFDRITIIAQQIYETLGRAIKLPISSTADPTLPTPSPNEVIAWNSTGDGFTNISLGDLATVSGYADARVEVYAGTGAQVAFGISFNPGVLANLDISVGGVTQTAGVDFTWAGTTVTFTTAPPAGATVQIRYARPLAPVPNFDSILTSVGDAEAAATAAEAAAAAAGDKVPYTSLAASGGSALAGFLQSGTGPSSTPQTVQDKLRQVISVKDRPFGAKGDGIGFLDGAITSGTPNFVSASSTFVAGDVGKAIFIDGAGAAGATLVTTISAFVSATAVTLAATASTTVAAADGNYGTDDTAAINAALTYAGSLSIVRPAFAEYGWVLNGGSTVKFPAGLYMATAEIVVPYAVSVEGAGKNSTVFRSSATDAVMRNFGSPTMSGDYNQKGMAFRNFSISGMRSKTSQVGLAFLRVIAATIENVLVERCGSHGIALYEASVNKFSNVESIGNVAAGLYMTYGFNSWADRTGAAYPCNANSFYFIRCLQNDGAGVWLDVGTNGNTFYSANCEYNYASSATNTGYNVRITSDSYAPNAFYDLWTEGGCEAHVYLDGSDIGVTTKLTNWKHFGNGASGNVTRALIVEVGSAVLDGATGTTSSYAWLAGSTSPFRIQNKTTGTIRLRNCVGSSATGLTLVDDNTGSRVGLYNNLKQDNALADGSLYGQFTFYNDNGGGDGVAYRNDNQSHAWYQSRAFYKDILMGDGASAPDAGFMRVAAGQIGPRPGDRFNVGAAWNGSHLVMGAYRVWVDATGALRIKNGAPANDLDGTVVGAQT